MGSLSFLRYVVVTQQKCSAPEYGNADSKVNNLANLTMN
jgi:hypothetical protein